MRIIIAGALARELENRFPFLKLFVLVFLSASRSEGRMSEEASALPPPPTPQSATASSPAASQSKPQRLNPHDIRNADLVNRFLAATPPYLYSPPVGPPNFFFSEMLRSLVQARNNEQNTRFLASQFRRPRKRLWPQNRCMFDSGASAMAPAAAEGGSSLAEKPLELTNKSFASTKSEAATKESPNQERRKASPEPPAKTLRNYSPPAAAVSTEPPTASLPPSDVVVPAAPPLWYPHLYPPYGIDPLHFFIDLRVSSHIYDRKKENVSPSAADNNNTTIAANLEAGPLNKHRVGSAFSVPPRREKSPLALNLTSAALPGDKPPLEFFNSTADAVDDKATRNTNYVLQNLPRIYTSLTSQGNEDKRSVASDDFDMRSDNEQNDFDARDNEHSSLHSDDVVIVDQDSEQSDRKYVKRLGRI